MSKKIHIAWPIICKVELEDAIDKFNSVLEKVSYRGDKDVLVQAMKSIIFEGEKVSEMLEEAYGK